MVQDNRAAPPNTSQIEEAGGDLEEATENQQGELSEEEVAELNEQIAKDQKEAAEYWEEERQKKVDESDGSVKADPLKPSSHEKENRKAEADDAAQKNEAARKQREDEAKKAADAAKDPKKPEHK